MILTQKGPLKKIEISCGIVLINHKIKPYTNTSGFLFHFENYYLTKKH